MLDIMLCFGLWGIAVLVVLKSEYLNDVADMIKEEMHTVLAFFVKLVVFLGAIVVVALLGKIAEWILESVFQPLIDLLLYIKSF